jgi:hypothetical protein
MVKKIIYFLFVNLSISILCFAVYISVQEITHIPERRSEKEMEKEWKDRLKKYSLPKYAIELKYRFSFPSDELVANDIYLSNSCRIALNGLGQVFVLDTKWRHIYQFDSDGNYLRTIGRKGQGPGEFMTPFCICTSENRLFVIDNGNRNIQVFDINGKLIKSTKTSKSYWDLETDANGHLLAASTSSVSNEPFLIDVFTEDAQYVKSIIKPNLNLPIKRQMTKSIHLAVNSKGEIFIAYENIPFVYKYNSEGDLIDQWKIDRDEMIEGAKLNIERSSRNEFSRQAPVIWGIQASLEGGFYLFQNYPRTEILEFDKNGRPINDYWYAKSFDYRGIDFKIFEKTKDVYILQMNPDSKIDVFRPKLRI